MDLQHVVLSEVFALRTDQLECTFKPGHSDVPLSPGILESIGSILIYSICFHRELQVALVHLEVSKMEELHINKIEVWQHAVFICLWEAAFIKASGPESNQLFDNIPGVQQLSELDKHLCNETPIFSLAIYCRYINQLLNYQGAYFLIRSFRTSAYRYEWCSETLVFGKTDQNFDTRARGRTRRSKWWPWSLDTSFKVHNTWLVIDIVNFSMDSSGNVCLLDNSS